MSSCSIVRMLRQPSRLLHWRLARLATPQVAGWQPRLTLPLVALRTFAPPLQMAEPALASFMYSSVLSQTSLDKALAFVLSNKLGTTVLGSVQLMELFQVRAKRAFLGGLPIARIKVHLFCSSSLSLFQVSMLRAHTSEPR